MVKLVKNRLASASLLSALLAAPAPLLQAQRPAAPSLVLRLAPHVGDTLHTRLEQQTEVTATLNGGDTRSITTNVTIASRTIVWSVLPSSTRVLTIVDSADVSSSDAHGAALAAQAEAMLKGQQLVLQLAADGTVESAKDARGGPVSRDMAEAMSAMPAVFPRRAVGVGDSWTREMPLPAGGPLGTRGSGHVHAVFRLDSLTRGGNLAFVSMKGDILPDSVGQGVKLSGNVAGSMLLDRARGWMTDSRFVVTVRSLVVPPKGTGLAPMQFVTRVTQRLRTMDKR
jgi:hypothetical protein